MRRTMTPLRLAPEYDMPGRAAERRSQATKWRSPVSLLSRVLTLLRVKTTVLVNRTEDPRQTLDYAYEKQQELLLRVRRGLVEVSTSRNQLDQLRVRQEGGLARTEDQARRALAAGREDLARVALSRKQAAMLEIAALGAQAADLAREESKLSLAEQQLAGRLQEFRTHRTTLSARYTAAEAQVRVNEALGGISDQFAEVGMALGRAEEKIERMQARSIAIVTLLASGSLSLPGATTDPVERELASMAAATAIESELAAMRAEQLPAPAPDRLLTGGSSVR